MCSCTGEWEWVTPGTKSSAASCELAVITGLAGTSLSLSLSLRAAGLWDTHKDGIRSYWSLSGCVSVNSMINTAKRQAWVLRATVPPLVYRLPIKCHKDREEMREERQDIPSVPAQGHSACPEGQWLWGKVCHGCVSLHHCDSLSCLHSHKCLSMLSHLLTVWAGVIGVFVSVCVLMCLGFCTSQVVYHKEHLP